MTFPTVGGMSDEDKERVRREFTDILGESDIDTSQVRTSEQPFPRRRGRPPGSKNRPKPSDYEPIYTDPTDERARPTLANPPLTTRDQKEVAKRLAGILQGISGVASVAKPYFEMTDEEAEAIATPLSTYLIRTEPTSGVAKQILEEYDMAAFAIALMAYCVRVYLDFKKERDSIRAERESEQPVKNVTPINPGTVQQPFSPGTVEPAVGETIQQPGLQSQSDAGETGPVSKVGVSVSEGPWNASQL